MSATNAWNHVKDMTATLGKGIGDGVMSVGRHAVSAVTGTPGAFMNSARNNSFGGAENPVMFYVAGLLGAGGHVLGEAVGGVGDAAMSVARSLPSAAGSGIAAVGELFTGGGGESRSAPATEQTAPSATQTASTQNSSVPTLADLGGLSPSTPSNGQVSSQETFLG